jgi:threonyl-tRNA synthetase
MAKVPYMAVVGQREAESGQVSIRHRTAGDCGSVTMERLIGGLQEEIQKKNTGGTVFQAAKS